MRLRQPDNSFHYDFVGWADITQPNNYTNYGRLPNTVRHTFNNRNYDREYVMYFIWTGSDLIGTIGNGAYENPNPNTGNRGWRSTPSVSYTHLTLPTIYSV